VRRLPDGSLVLLDWAAVQKRDATLHYGGTLGAVGEALRGAGRRWALAADDLDAAPAAATSAPAGARPPPC
jgi:hypothetical protein